MSNRDDYFVEEATIESDEQGFELHLLLASGDRKIFNVHACSSQLMREVMREIRPYEDEMDRYGTTKRGGQGG